MSQNKNLKFASQVIHGGQEPDPTTGAVMMPIYATSTYVQSSPGQHKGWEYSRSHNPTRHAFESAIATLEGGVAGFAFGSGMAAITALMEMLEVGDHIVAVDDLYGGTVRLFNQVKKTSQNLEVSYVNADDLDAFEKAIKPNTKMIWVESPTNPMLRLADLKALSAIAKKHGVIAVCDNTFATPYLQNPIEMGFDIIIHSVTKYINGHSDVVGGALVAANEELAEKIGYIQNATGGVLGPFDSFLALRGIKTLDVRMQRHCENAMALATYLEGHPKIDSVIFPGLASHPHHELAKRQMRGFGGMLSFYVKGGLDSTVKFLENCKVFTLAESLGGVESLIEHPAIMTHGSVSPEVREKLGITDNFVRASVGIEDIEDLKADIDQALNFA